METVDYHYKSKSVEERSLYDNVTLFNWVICFVALCAGFGVLLILLYEDWYCTLSSLQLLVIPACILGLIPSLFWTLIYVIWTILSVFRTLIRIAIFTTFRMLWYGVKTVLWAILAPVVLSLVFVVTVVVIGLFATSPMLHTVSNTLLKFLSWFTPIKS